MKIYEKLAFEALDSIAICLKQFFLYTALMLLFIPTFTLEIEKKMSIASIFAFAMLDEAIAGLNDDEKEKLLNDSFENDEFYSVQIFYPKGVKTFDLSLQRSFYYSKYFTCFESAILNQSAANSRTLAIVKRFLDYYLICHDDRDFLVLRRPLISSESGSSLTKEQIFFHRAHPHRIDEFISNFYGSSSFDDMDDIFNEYWLYNQLAKDTFWYNVESITIFGFPLSMNLITAGSLIFYVYLIRRASLSFGVLRRSREKLGFLPATQFTIWIAKKIEIIGDLGDYPAFSGDTRSSFLFLILFVANFVPIFYRTQKMAVDLGGGLADHLTLLDLFIIGFGTLFAIQVFRIARYIQTNVGVATFDNE